MAYSIEFREGVPYILTSRIRRGEFAIAKLDEYIRNDFQKEITRLKDILALAR